MTFVLIALTILMLVFVALFWTLGPIALWAVARMDASAARQHAVDMERLMARQAQQAEDAARLHDELATKFRRL